MTLQRIAWVAVVTGSALLTTGTTALAEHGRVGFLTSRLQGQAGQMSDELRHYWTRVPQYGSLLAGSRTVHRFAGLVENSWRHGHNPIVGHNYLKVIEQRILHMQQRLDDLEDWRMRRHHGHHGHHRGGYGTHAPYDTRSLRAMLAGMKCTTAELKDAVCHVHRGPRHAGPAHARPAHAGPTHTAPPYGSHHSGLRPGYGKPGYEKTGYGRSIYRKPGVHFGHNGLHLAGPGGIAFRIGW